jgi:phosphoglycolate phosphatase
MASTDLGAVLFDLDGTLVDSVADATAILNAVLEPEGVAPFAPGEVRVLMGHGIRALLAKALAARGSPAQPDRLDALRDRYLALYMAEPLRETRLFPGASEALQALAAGGFRLGVCTNKAGGPARLVLEGLGLDALIHATVAADDGHGQKPAPGPLLACAAALGIAPERCVYVGDHAVDVEAARAAGMPVVVTGFGYSERPAEALGADRVIERLADLPSVARELVARR